MFSFSHQSRRQTGKTCERPAFTFILQYSNPITVKMGRKHFTPGMFLLTLVNAFANLNDTNTDFINFSFG